MKKGLVIYENDNVLFEGKPLEMPIKKDAIVQKSIELFDDEDPCIIHRSHVIRHFADILENRLKQEDGVLRIEDHPDIEAFLDVDDPGTITIHKKR